MSATRATRTRARARVRARLSISLSLYLSLPQTHIARAQTHASSVCLTTRALNTHISGASARVCVSLPLSQRHTSHARQHAHRVSVQHTRVCVCVHGRCACACVCVCLSTCEKMRGHTAREPKNCSQILRYECVADTKKIWSGRAPNSRRRARKLSSRRAREKSRRCRARILDGVERRILVDAARDDSRAKIYNHSHKHKQLTTLSRASEQQPARVICRACAERLALNRSAVESV